MDQTVKDLSEVIDTIFGLPEGTTQEKVAAKAAAAFEAKRRRIMRNNQKYEAMLALVSEKQADKMLSLASSEYETNKVFQWKGIPRVAVMMVKRRVWNEAKMIPGTKIVVVYPDGTTAETFEKSITIRKEF